MSKFHKEEVMSQAEIREFKDRLKVSFVGGVEESLENEIRILVNENNEEEVVKNKGLFKININPSTLIDDLCLDPRLNDEEYNKYKIQIEKISKLPIFQSDLYKFNLAPIDME